MQVWGTTNYGSEVPPNASLHVISSERSYERSYRHGDKVLLLVAGRENIPLIMASPNSKLNWVINSRIKKPRICRKQRQIRGFEILVIGNQIESTPDA